LDLDLTDDQELFRDTTRRFLADKWPVPAVRGLLDDPVGVDLGLWAQGAELGWTSLLVPEEHGGGSISGAGVRDLGIVAEELGRALVAGPALPTNIVAFALARSDGDLARVVLPRLASGETIACWAAAELAVVATGGGFRLTGTVSPVQDAHVAHHLLVTGNRSVQALVPLDATGVTVERLDGLDLTRRHCRVRLDDVAVPADATIGAPGGSGRELDRQLALVLALQCAETVGATEAVFDLTLAYVKERKAFGRPIGSYQALKHRLAEMLLWLESAKAATDAALTAVQSEHDALPAARVAKAYVADRCPTIARECLQMHGGIGFTWEHDIHLFLRRIDANAAIHGGAGHQLDALASTIGLPGDAA
jgi:alkylation response protein AidB-like acyl-CoA dehydrogenase